MAVRKDLPELLGIINKVIDLITPEQNLQIRSKWLSVRYEYGISKADILKWILAISIFSLLIVVIVLFWNRKLKKTENELKESERRLSTLIGNLPGIAYRCQNDVNWTMLYISNGCYELTGYEPVELVKNKILSYGDLIVEADKQYVQDEIQIAIEERRAFAIEYRIRDINKNTLYFPYHVDTTDDDFFPISDFDTNNSLTGLVVSRCKPMLFRKIDLEKLSAQKGVWGPVPLIWMGAPLIVKDEVIGVVAVQSYLDSNLYNEQDLQVLSGVSDQITIAIDRKRTEMTLLESEKKWSGSMCHFE